MSKGTTFNHSPDRFSAGECWLPDLIGDAIPLILSDFKNGIYAINGVGKVRSDIWTNVDYAPQGTVTPGQGLVYTSAVVGDPTFCVDTMKDNAAFAALANGFTAVVDYVVSGTGVVDTLGIEYADNVGYTVGASIYIGAGAQGTYFGDYAGHSTSPATNDGEAQGRHKTAMRISGPQLSAAIDGNLYGPLDVTNDFSAAVAMSLYANVSATLPTITIEKAEFFALSRYNAASLPNIT